MVLEYLDSPSSLHSTHASDHSNVLKVSQKYKRISMEKRKLLLEKIFFENKKIKKAAKELHLNYSSAKTILHLYRMKIKKPQIEEYSKELKRCNYSTLNSKNSFNHIEIVVTQGGRLLNDAIFKENFFEIKPLVKKFITHIKEEPKKIEAETMSYIQNYLLYKEIEEKLLTKKPNYPQKTLYHNIESETTRNCYRKAIIIKPIDSDYLSL